ncbi:MAG: UMP kinase [Patescibacteria group bacterium]
MKKGVKSKKAIVISLGGSVLVPQEGYINYLFLKKFKEIVLKYIEQGYFFVIVTGGGKTCRLYQNAAKKVTKLVPEDVDWLGIHSTRLNAHLLRTIFRQWAHQRIIDDPRIREKVKESILIGAGWRPGTSTDYDAVRLAISYGAKEVINLSNIDYVYSGDPRKDPQAKRLAKISWLDFLKLVGAKWTPGANWPFDPVASRLAKKAGIKVLVMDGHKVANFERYLKTGQFEGTTISN